MPRVLVISDTQCPFVHKHYLYFLKEVYRRHKCDTVVHVGDEIDHHAMSDYAPDPDGYSAGHELVAAIEILKPYYQAFPKVMVCESNHRARILKRAYKSGIPVRYMKDFKEVIEAPDGWRWAEKWEIDKVGYKHGCGYSGTMGALNAAKDEMKSCVIGHLHSDAGLLFWSNGLETIFGMNVGCGIDQESYAFAYAKTSRKKAVLSCGVVIDGKPQLILMRTNKHGEWVGNL
jgi:predicted phosphodiesterase